MKIITIVFLILLSFFILRADPANAQTAVSASDLISLVNGMRSAYGLSALSVDSSLMYCAQNTADTMAANSMSWHIGNASGRASASGYNGGGTCFATENFMMGAETTSISQIQAAWADSSHMIPMTDNRYCHIGAGVSAAVNGMVYFVVQAAYPGNSSSCAFSSSSPRSATSAPGAVTGASTIDVSQIIKNVTVATVNADGIIYHEVAEGQTLWSIATAYETTVEEISSWNNLGELTNLSLGQKLIIPAKNAVKPTPELAMTVLPTADAAGAYRHTVVEGETLWSISELWKANIQDIYRINGLDEDSSIGLGWKLIIPVTATVTPIPTITQQPTATAENTLTPLPTLEQSPTPVISPTTESKSHLPKADVKTFLILGGFFAVLLIVVGLLIQKIMASKH